MSGNVQSFTRVESLVSASLIQKLNLKYNFAHILYWCETSSFTPMVFENRMVMKML
jgi:hypothetical protein